MAEKEEINEDNIDALLHDAILEGSVEAAGITEDGGLTFKITEQGEHYVINELMGGKDVAETAQKILSALAKHGVMGFPLPDNFTSFLIVATCLKIFKHYRNWETLVKID